MYKNQLSFFFWPKTLLGDLFPLIMGVARHFHYPIKTMTNFSISFYREISHLLGQGALVNLDKGSDNNLLIVGYT
jgi:hypothetical protein